MAIQIDADFECGNIEVVALRPDGADLSIRKDLNGPWYQWFYFRVSGGADRDLTLRIVNAAGSSYAEGWLGYRACVSDDGAGWRRSETDYRDGVLEIRARPAGDTAWFAFFAPYDLRRLAGFLDRASARPGVIRATLGRTVQGRAIDCLALGQGPKQIWLIGRQHSGETMASWWLEGAFDRLLEPASDRLLQKATFHLAPLVNVDGAAIGNLRGNAAGLDLNRQWHDPDPNRAPEVFSILTAMDRTGVDLMLDIHGDETIPHVFIDGCESDPGVSPAQADGVARYRAALLARSAAFQTRVGYPVTYGGDAGHGMANRAVARRYGAIGMTLEMPFKDCLEAPDPLRGWSPEACAQMGRDCIDALVDMLG